MATANTTNFMNDKASFEKMGTKFQQNLVQLMLEDRAFCDQMAEVLDINFLELKYLRVFLEKILTYRKKYGIHPTYDNMVTILRTDMDKETDVIKDQVREYFAKIETTQFSLRQHLQTQSRIT